MKISHVFIAGLLSSLMANFIYEYLKGKITDGKIN